MALAQYEAMCALFPTAALPKDFGAATPIDTPTLILSGAFDPATPPRWGEAVGERLGRSRHVVVPGTTHGCWRHGAVGGLMARFLTSADPEALDPSVVENVEAQPFFLSTAGPIAAPAAKEAP